MRRAMAATMLLGGGLLVWGCGNKGGDGVEAKPASTQAPAATTTAAAAATTAAPAAEAPPTKATPLPEGRSGPPTLEEWNTIKKEVTVKGSSALKCETKIVREYLRVSCRGKVPEGTPTGIKLIKGGREALVFASGGIASLVLPYVEGTDFEAAFSWTQKSHKLSVKWPKGSKQPVIVGTFEGAASPLDGTAQGDNDKLCACHKKVTNATTCEDVYGGADADCDRTYGDNCPKLLACSRHDGTARPQCLPGFVQLFGLICRKECGQGKPACPAGQVCAGATSTCE